MSQNKVDLALELFRNYKTGFIKKVKPVVTERTSAPGDPTLISDVLANLVSDRQWESGLAEGNLFAQWEKIVGSDIATHTTPISFSMAYFSFNVHQLHGQHNCNQCTINL